MGENRALSSGLLGAQLASLRFVAVHFTLPITTRHFAKLPFYCMLCFFFKALLILESCLSKMLKIKTKVIRVKGKSLLLEKLGLFRTVHDPQTSPSNRCNVGQS